jgi:hypothetical protein
MVLTMNPVCVVVGKDIYTIIQCVCGIYKAYCIGRDRVCGGW